MDTAPAPRKLLTNDAAFRDVSRGNPKPHTLQGEALVQAGLTPETWRLEIVSDGSAKVARPCTVADGTALDLPTLRALGKTHGVKFLKAMQCLNIAQPLGHGLWEGVPLREVLKRVGKVSNVRRMYYWGFHNNDPKQIFQSSLGYNQVMETPPGDLPVFVAYALNGEPLSLKRGGPVRMIVPWAHGFKSIKWLQRIVLTNDYKANDTYAESNNNDPDSYLKTMARIDDGPDSYRAGTAVILRGVALAGWSGLERVEYWLRPDTGTHGQLAEDDPAWQTATWKPAPIDPPPSDWSSQLPEGVAARDILGFDPNGVPRTWPLRYSIATWSVTLKDLAPGAYEFRVRTVDRNGYAQPEPRPYPKSGRNEVMCKTFMVTS